MAYTSGAVIDVPFELWNVGVLSDPSDDYKMICWIYDYDGSGTYNWHGELEDSGADNDPGTIGVLEKPKQHITWNSRL